MERSAAGRVAAKTRGSLGGRSEKLTDSDLKLFKTLVDSGAPIITIGEKWNVSRTTIYRYLKKLKDLNKSHLNLSTVKLLVYIENIFKNMHTSYMEVLL